MQALSPVRVRRLAALSLLAGLLSLTSPASADAPAPATPAPVRVRIETSQGNFVIQLDAERAPLSTANFLSYAKTGFYNGTIFHRVVSNFVIQGGGYDEKYQVKPTSPAVPNESGNGLSNKRGSVGLARGEAPHSGNAQFYVNLTDNENLDPTPLRWGYAVFGRVVEGMEVIDRLGHVETGKGGPFPENVPVQAIVIQKVVLLNAAGTAAATPDPTPTPAAAHRP